LSMVYGFVQRSGGHVKIYSEPDQGTTFRIYLPHATEGTNGSGQADTLANDDLPRGDEMVLVVEDEESLLDVAVSHLRSLGYRTLTAPNAKQALEMLQEHKEIDLLFTDVMMPGDMNGYELAIDVLKQHSGIKVLLTSGFTAKRETAPDGDRPLYEKLTKDLVNKPYNIFELAIAVRQALEKE